ncbi:hypothetical protein GCM10011575_46160 [Microlunatus endophyticus]|uniref:Uncharacterized protein n=1 Tax=Microlunatus endophyticus TaxID=1716077 RepID=A0A917SJN8_9ACTN|nr:hypothetical protein [Microlunatus endophyticus]GGL82632.1 hypothetical protein GCM10011575_46160 [Microlunatus endophyticus]
MRWLREVIALVVVGGGIFSIGLSASLRGWYLAGVVVAALGLGLLAVIILALLPVSRWLRWVVGGALALILVGAGVLSPQLAIGRPDSRPLWQTTGSGPQARLVGGRLYLHSEYTDQVLEPDSGRILVSVPAESQGLTVGLDGSFVQLGNGTVVYRDSDGRQRWKLGTDVSVTVLAIANGWVVMRGCSKEHDVVCGVDPKGGSAGGKSKPQMSAGSPRSAGNGNTTAAPRLGRQTA